MLRMFATAATLLYTLDSFACWKLNGKLAVDGEIFEFEQKVDEKKDHYFPIGTFILEASVKLNEKETWIFTYKLQEKKGLALDLVTRGEERNIKVKKAHDIFAQGEEGQPNTIITIKLSPL